MYVYAIIVALPLLLGRVFGVNPASNSGDEPLATSAYWQQAEQITTEHRDLWEDVFCRFDLSADECQAIIFPELMRYSAFQDAIEEAALLSLYVSGGSAASNFSIGLFQMKPSFVEEVEMAWMASKLRHKYQLYFPRGESREARRRRVERLSDEEWQCVYIALFVRLLLEREPSLLELPPCQRVSLLAAAYNYSFTAPLEQLRIAQSQKYFHLSLFRLSNTPCYSYAEIAVERYRQLTK